MRYSLRHETRLKKRSSVNDPAVNLRLILYNISEIDIVIILSE